MTLSQSDKAFLNKKKKKIMNIDAFNMIIYTTFQYVNAKLQVKKS